MKTLRLVTLLLLANLLFVNTSVQAANVLKGKQTRQVTGFHGISVSSGIHLQLTQENVEKVVVEAESDDMEKIITKVEDGILKIYVKDKSWSGFNWKNRTLKVYVSFKEMDKLHASAGSGVDAESSFKLGSFALHVSSGANVKLDLEATDMDVSASSGCGIVLKGKAREIKADASSGSHINAAELECKKCKASVSSGANIKVNVTEDLDANASSGGGITYSGNPATKNIHKSSGGGVSSR
jgi:hypothetical protein